MNASKHGWVRHLKVGQFFTPRGFVAAACQVSVLFLVMHLLGLRDCTTIFIGAVPAPGLGGRFAAGLGLAYIVFYIAFTVGVPALLIGAGLLRAAKPLWATCPTDAEQIGPRSSSASHR